MNWNDHFTYDETTHSCLRGKPSTRNKYGLPKGFLSKTCNYWRVKVEGKTYVAHRIVWEIHKGVIPDELEIDHLDGNCLNNRIENLRMVSKTINSRNKARRKDNTTGVQGISSSHNNLGNKYFVVQWTNADGKIVRKRFSCTKLGDIGALEAALKFQSDQRDVLIGCGYTERHISGN